MHTEKEVLTSFQISNDTEFLWLVVSGAPTVHWVHVTDGKEENDEQWPYQIRLTGTTVDEVMINKPTGP